MIMPERTQPGRSRLRGKAAAPPTLSARDKPLTPDLHTFSLPNARAAAGVPVCVCRWLCVALLFSAVLAHGRTLEVIRVGSEPAAGDIENARAAFQQGKAIVVLERGGRAEVSRLLGIELPASTPMSKTGTQPITAATPGTPELEKSAAAYIDASQTLHSLQVFADSKATDAAWRKPREAWIAKQQAMATGSGVSTAQPPEQAWTTMLMTTLSSTDSVGDTEQTNISVFRLNTIDAANDYYMVYMTPESLPAYDGFCDGIGDCSSHTFGRHFQLGLAGAELYEHGPPNEINVTTISFNFGGSVSAEGPGLNTGFGVSWSQPDVTTTDESNSFTGIWQEQFVANYFNRCDPATGQLNATSYGAFSSNQLAIFKVPAGTTDLKFPVQDEATWCGTMNPYGFPYNFYNYTQNDTTIQLGSPVLQGTPANLTVPAGGSQPLLVTALIPYSSEGLSWKISTNQSWLTVPSEGPYSQTQAIPVSVAPSTPDGSTGTVSIETSDPFATRSVLKGPVLVNVTVGNAVATNRTGVLLTGGKTTQGSFALTSFYNLATNTIDPAGQLQVSRYAHTATTLQNGDVVVIGGDTSFPVDNEGSPTVTGLAEVYHPASLAFSPSGVMLVPRGAHTATLLPDGKVLITGGVDGSGNYVSQAELYDPPARSFSAAGTTTGIGYGSGATLISSPGAPAQVLVYGGSNANTQLWSEATKSFTDAASMAAIQGEFATPVLNSRGEYVIAAGTDATGFNTTLVQNLSPTSHDFQTASPLTRARGENTLTKLANGALLVAGGAVDGSATAELQGSDSNSWDLLSGGSPCPGSSGCMQTYRYSHTATLLPNGSVFLAGGLSRDNDPIPSTELFNPANGQFTTGPVDDAQGQHTANFISTSTTALQVSPSPASAGQLVTLVASVSVGTGRPSGTVTFYDGGTSLGSSPIKQGGAVLTTSTLGVGSHTLTASYQDDGVNAGSTSSPVTEVIGDDPSAIQLSSSINPSSPGQAVRLKATITSSTPASGGVVTFKDGNTVLGTRSVSATGAAYETSSLNVGTHRLTAKYSGDPTHQASTSPVLDQVVQAETSTVGLTVKPGSIAFGATVVLAAKVSGDPPLLGAVTFKDGAAALGTVALANGVASLSSSMLAVGANSLTAVYSGDATHAGGASPSVMVTVTPATPTVLVASTRNPSVVGQSVTFSVTVTGGKVTPTGTIQFYDGSTPLGAAVTLRAGAASITPPPLAEGTHTIYASFSPGDGNYISAGSAGLIQQVNGVATKTALSVAGTPVAGNRLTFTATVSGNAPTGTVVFNDGSTSLGSASLNAGTAIFATTGLGVGNHSITADYLGQGNNNASISAPLTVLVAPAAVNVHISSSLNPSRVGEQVTFTVTTSSTGGVPAGTVTLRDGNAALGAPKPLVQGSVAITATFLGAGSKQISAHYTGGGNFSPATSPPITQTVTNAP
jgi:hypothetical protein